MTIDANGLRSTGIPIIDSKGPCVAAVGDSYTFGDEVSDDEAWPAKLQELLGQPVLNGGVFGYGMDQIVLRAEQLLDRHPCIETLLLSILPDDVIRCEYSYRFAWKPYFDVEESHLAIRNVPVPRGKAREAWIKRILGYSYLADFGLSLAVPQIWLAAPFDARRVHDQGSAVGVLLLDRLYKEAKRRSVHLVLVVQGHPGHDGSPAVPVIRRARQLGIEVLDLLTEIQSFAARYPKVKDLFYRPHRSGIWGHMTASGNAWVAEKIAEILQADCGLAGPRRPCRKSRPSQAVNRDSRGTCGNWNGPIENVAERWRPAVARSCSTSAARPLTRYRAQRKEYSSSSNN